MSLALYILLTGIDLWQTALGLKRGLREGNPFLRGLGVRGMAVMKVLGVAIVWHADYSPLTWALCALEAAVVWSNHRLLMKRGATRHAA